MENKEKTINYLQETLSGILAGTQQHFMHATINKYKGFKKLSDRMMEEIQEEMDGAAKFINRIMELGGTPELNPDKWPIYMDVKEQLNVEFEEQEMALKALNNIIKDIEDDEVTSQIFQDYLVDETDHRQWLKQQLNLIESIGLQNYLSSQV